MGGKKKKSTRRRQDNVDDDVQKPQEDRFDTDHKPQFRALTSSSEDQKVVLDDRFASVLTDPRFQLTVRDKYGRNKKSSKQSKQKKNESNKELEAFYSVKEKEGEKDDDDNDDDEVNDQAKKRESKKDEKPVENSSSSSSDDSDEEENEKDKSTKGDEDQGDPASRIAYLTALSRGELDVSSSSSSEDDDDDDEDVDQKANNSDDESDDDAEKGDGAIMGKAGILDPSYHHSNDTTPEDEDEENVDLTFEPSKYLAVLNLDWSHVRAVDIFAICSSFTPAGGVEKVQVYPSDFGMERIAKEDQFGPSGLWKPHKQTSDETNEEGGNNSENEDDDDEDNKSSSDESKESLDGKKGAGKEKDDMESDPEDEQQEEEDDDDEEDAALEDFLPKEDHVESDFDPEKLREYEASRLKYYFAVVTFTSDSHADLCYKEVDGIEFEHSSVAIDVRAIPPNELLGVIQNRPIRDEATSIPSNYVPPDFVVSALQQTNVKCNWEAGDDHRDRLLTKYSTAGQDWKTLAESDDLKAYLASDASSDEEEEGNSDDEEGKAKKKAAMMRKMLGLEDGSGDDDDEDNGSGGEKEAKIAVANKSSDNESDDSSHAQSDDEMEVDEGQNKEMKFMPGAKDLAEKIRSKVEQKSAGGLTAWEKYLQKRKEKKKEKKEEAKEKREAINKKRRGKDDSSDEEADSDDNEDDFLVDETKQKKGSKSKGKGEHSTKPKINKEELELLVAGDDEDEEKRDFDMRGLQRMDKNKDKKLRGARKRKEAQLAADVSGTDFQVDLQDNRFNALLDGQDARFGIDRTDPNFKDTPAMRQVMEEQGRRRKKKRRRKGGNQEETSAPVSAEDVAAGNKTGKSEKASALSSLVSKLKSKVQ